MILSLQKLDLWLMLSLPITWPAIGWATCPNSPLQSWDQQTGGCPEHPWSCDLQEGAPLPPTGGLLLLSPKVVVRPPYPLCCPTSSRYKLARQSGFSEKSKFLENQYGIILVTAQSPKGSTRNSVWTRAWMGPSESLVLNI